MSSHIHSHLTEDLEPVVISIVSEAWRFAATFERLIGQVSATDARRYHARLAYFRDRIQQELGAAGLHVADMAPGVAYEPGMAATPINLDDFNDGDELVIDQVIEPTIMGAEGIRRMGTVTLRKVN